MTNGLVLVLGGIRSGKSRFAEELASVSDDVLYIATCVAGDGELAERVERHRARRPGHWETLEEPIEIEAALEKRSDSQNVYLLDCLSFLVFNWQELGLGPEAIGARAEELAVYLRRSERRVIVVSNDVSGGLIPAERASRDYQEALGLANQAFALLADEVFQTVAGIGVRIKP